MFEVPQTPKYQGIREALAAIDSMMVFPAMPTIPLQIVPVVKDGSAGAYVRQRGGAPLRIEIAEGADYPELTAIHEVAHYLDDCGLSATEGWASEVDPRLEPLRQAWENTEAVRALRIGLETEKMTAVLPNGETFEFPLLPEERENCRYYLQGRELFARSYAQYIAAKSQNRVLLGQVRRRRESVEGRFYHVQWTANDFRAVAKVFDTLWKELGWLR